ncbi:MAG: M20/M25/M40 family metallo-hydrolase [Kiritimatiellae bacterium]|nr:M20/M25/M40 family metallo-hydrolase [Kiritimatiellia bacterium]
MTKSATVLMASMCVSACACATDMEFLGELVAIPSASADIPQVNRAMHAMKAYLEKRGVWCVMERHPGGNEILFAATRPGKVQDFVIAAHLDVVPASVEGQYEMKYRDGKIVGRGVSDCKGRCVVVAETLARLNGKASVGCIFGADEELGGAMTEWMVKERGYRPGKMVIVADSAYGKVFYAHKGHGLISLKAKGRGGHSARPWDCDDSITRLVRGYLKVRDAWDARHPASEGQWRDLVTTTIMRSKGEAMNRIPGEAEIVVNLRNVNPGAKDELLGMIRELTDCEVEVLRYSPPVYSDPDHPLVRGVLKAMREVCGKGELDRMPAATDARCFVGCGVPIAIVGTLGGNAHGDSEWADPSTFDLFGEWLARFLSDPDKYAATP